MKKKIDKNLIEKLFKLSFILFVVISVIGLSIFGFDYLKILVFKCSISFNFMFSYN